MSLRRPAKNQPENFEFNPKNIEIAEKIIEKEFPTARCIM